eukprot:1140715-Pelagomonas_calceolata.AAC.9
MYKEVCYSLQLAKSAHYTASCIHRADPLHTCNTEQDPHHGGPMTHGTQVKMMKAAAACQPAHSACALPDRQHSTACLNTRVRDALVSSIAPVAAYLCASLRLRKQPMRQLRTSSSFARKAIPTVKQFLFSTIMKAQHQQGAHHHTMLAFSGRARLTRAPLGGPLAPVDFRPLNVCSKGPLGGQRPPVDFRPQLSPRLSLELNAMIRTLSLSLHWTMLSTMLRCYQQWRDSLKSEAKCCPHVCQIYALEGQGVLYKCALADLQRH